MMRKENVPGNGFKDVNLCNNFRDCIGGIARIRDLN